MKWELRKSTLTKRSIVIDCSVPPHPGNLGVRILFLFVIFVVHPSKYIADDKNDIDQGQTQ